MHIIFASASFASQYQLLDLCENILEAWPKLSSSKLLLKWLEEHPDPARVALLDSGVFTTWTKGEVVDLDKYAEFIKTELAGPKRFSHYVGLDVIPGAPGVMPDAAMVAASAAKGWDNFMRLLDKGIPTDRIIHVFHQGEEIHWLEKLVALHEELVAKGTPGLYIGISPANDRTTLQRIMWLDQIMPIVTKPDGSAKLRWHGFGATSFRLLKRYPWFTADSTSWMRPGAMGQLSMAAEGARAIDGALLVSVTDRTGISQANKHYCGLSKHEQDYVVSKIEDAGFTLEDVRRDDKLGVLSRQTVNLKFWKQAERELNTMDLRWKPIQAQFC
jgi:hypothetical protein